jgi:hypothetical protein
MDGVKSLQAVFSEKLFAVPDYQRGYSWDSRHRKELLEDLELLRPDHEHYAGTLVLHCAPDATRVKNVDGKWLSRCDVVDGQQRLTTLIMLLDALQRELAGINYRDILAAGIRKDYVVGSDVNQQPLLRLILNRDCQDFWASAILTENEGVLAPTIQSHHRLRDARREFRSYVRDLEAKSDEEPGTALESLTDKITQQLRFTVYEVGEAAEVGVIFEVMNNRGKPLSELEKVKNFLLYLSSRLELEDHGLSDKVNTAWTHVFECLAAAGLTTTADEDQLLRIHWLVAYEHNPKTWDGSRSVKKLFDLRTWRGRHRALLSDVIAYVDSLRQMAVAFADARSPMQTAAFGSWPQNERADAVNRSEKLLRIGIVAPFLPVLVAARIRAAHNPATYISFVDAFERYAFRVYRGVERRSNVGHSWLRSIGWRLWHNQLTIDQALAEVWSAVAHYSPQDELEEKLNKVRDWYWWSGLRYFLYEYEEHLSDRNEIKLRWAQVEERDLGKCVEHVLPQTPSDPYWTARFTEEEISQLTHDLGNLCLSTVSANPAYSNKPFPEKRGNPGQTSACYAKAFLAQERELATQTDWTPDTIRDRHRALVAWALKRWSLPNTTEGPAETVPEKFPDDAEDGLA